MFHIIKGMVNNYKIMIMVEIRQNIWDKFEKSMGRQWEY